MSFGSSRFPWRLLCQQFFSSIIFRADGCQDATRLPRINLIFASQLLRIFCVERGSREYEKLRLCNKPFQSHLKQQAQPLIFNVANNCIFMMQSSTYSTTLSDMAWLRWPWSTRNRPSSLNQVFVWCQRLLSRNIAESCVEVRCERRRID